MLTLTALLLSAAAPAQGCPDLSGTYSDRDLFREELRQTGCTELSWTGAPHPKNPNPPGPPNDRPSTTLFHVDCLKHPDGFQMSAACWNRDVLELWTYAKNTQGKWVPFMIRRLQLDAAGLHDDAYLTDASGDERKYLQSYYRRERP